MKKTFCTKETLRKTTFNDYLTMYYFIECVFIGKKSEECLMVKITQLITQTIN